jgi:hypothetical protein
MTKLTKYYRQHAKKHWSQMVRSLLISTPLSLNELENAYMSSLKIEIANWFIIQIFPDIFATTFLDMDSELPSNVMHDKKIFLFITYYIRTMFYGPKRNGEKCSPRPHG